MDTPDYYGILGVHRDADIQEIRAAYKRLAMKHHPDRDGGDAEQFQRISRAWEFLSDADQRARYNDTGLDEDGIKLTVQNRMVQAFAGIIERGDFSGDLVDKIRKVIFDAIIEVDKKVPPLLALADRLEKATGRVTSSGEMNLFESLLEKKLDAVRRDVRVLDIEREIFEAMLEELKDYSDTGPTALDCLSGY